MAISLYLVLDREVISKMELRGPFTVSRRLGTDMRGTETNAPAYTLPMWWCESARRLLSHALLVARFPRFDYIGLGEFAGVW